MTEKSASVRVITSKILLVLLMLLVNQFVMGQSDDGLMWLIKNELHGNPGFKVLQREEHDVNHDGIRETLISLEDTTDESSADSVWFYILQQKSNAQWRVLLRNTGLIQCRHCGGAAGERGDFSVDSTGAIRFNASWGSRGRGERATTIRYNAVSNRWEVAWLELGWYDTLDPNALSPGSSGSWSFSADEFIKPIGVLEQMPAPDELIEDSLGVDKVLVVNAPKVFFRSSDNLSESSPAYLVQGDFVECVYELKNYYGCTYTVGNKQTAGFLPKNSLTAVPVKPVLNSPLHVLTTRAYLHSSPGSRFRTKIYLIKGNALHCDYATNGFLRCGYTKQDREEQIDITYYGFFKKTDVTSVND